MFEHTNIPIQQERSIISDLEKNNVNWIVVSNRVNSIELGMGIFGKTHCQVLWKYISSHYKVVAEFGDWVNPGGWGSQHGVRMMKRIN